MHSEIFSFDLEEVKYRKRQILEVERCSLVK